MQHSGIALHSISQHSSSSRCYVALLCSTVKTSETLFGSSLPALRFGTMKRWTVILHRKSMLSRTYWHNWWRTRSRYGRYKGSRSNSQSQPLLGSCSLLICAREWTFWHDMTPHHHLVYGSGAATISCTRYKQLWLRTRLKRGNGSRDQLEGRMFGQ